MEVDPRRFGFSETTTAADVELQSDSDQQSTHPNAEYESEELRDRKKDVRHSYQAMRWKRLQKHYSDEYVELFNTSSAQTVNLYEGQALPSSQVGAVRWSSDEKEQLFGAVARYGRNNLEQLSKAVSTKSPIEIVALLNTILDAYIDRQLFMANTKNASIAEFPTAIEIGPECEADLDIAADALIAYQEQFDIAVGQNQKGPSWLIDREMAMRLDTQADEVEADLSVESEPYIERDRSDGRTVENSCSRSLALLELSTMLDLSEEFFMNPPDGNKQLHWKAVAEHGQRPALTQECVQDFYSMVTDHLRQVIRLAIHAANTRILSMQSRGNSPSRNLRHADVLAALDVLNLPHDSWDFWTTLARRNKFHVITGSHSKGESRTTTISYDKAEAELAIRRGRGRRRSMSIGSEASSVANRDDASGGPSSGHETDRSRNSEIDFDEEEASDPSTDEEDIDGMGLDNAHEHSSDPSSSESENNDIKTEPRSDRKDRKILREDAIDEYAEIIDQKARVEDERKMWQILGKRLRTDIKEEDTEESEPRPKTSRKNPDEIRSWPRAYQAEWEHCGQLLLPPKQAIEDSDQD